MRPTQAVPRQRARGAHKGIHKILGAGLAGRDRYKRQLRKTAKSGLKFVHDDVGNAFHVGRHLAKTLDATYK